jgi:hypothetical protein
LPKAQNAWDFRSTTGKEKAIAKRSGADVEHKAFSDHPEIRPTLREESAFGEIQAGGLDPPNLPWCKLLSYRIIELEGGVLGAFGKSDPVVQNIDMLAGNEVEHGSWPTGKRELDAILKVGGRRDKRWESRTESENQEPNLLGSAGGKIGWPCSNYWGFWVLMESQTGSLRSVRQNPIVPRG